MATPDTQMEVLGEVYTSTTLNNGSEAILTEDKEPPFLPTTMESARQSDGLVWWRPDGVLTLDNPEKDSVMVRLG
jgi:hypothetical protein